MNTHHWTPSNSVALARSPPPGTSPWMFLIRRRTMMLVTFVMLFALASAVLYLAPQTYQASSTLLVERTRSPTMRTDYVPGVEMNEAMNTARIVASSRSVMAATIDKLGLAETSTPGDSFSATITRLIRNLFVRFGLIPKVSHRDDLINSLMHWVTVSNVVNSNILIITVRHEDKKLAANLANEITAQYIKQHLRIYSTHGLADFYREQTALAEAEYRAAGQRVIDFKATASLYAISASREEYTRELSALRSQLLTFTNDLNRLTRRYDPDHSEIAVARESMAAVETRIKDTEAKLQKLEKDEATLADLEMQLDNRRRTYIDFSNKYTEAAVNERADQDVVNVRQVEQAVVPSQPTISRILLLVMAFIGSAIVTVAAGLVRDYLDTHPTTVESVEQSLGLPVLGSLERLTAEQLPTFYAAHDKRILG
jgi:uncharacterized protein involved in exopolysaccharide biosynthesis